MKSNVKTTSMCFVIWTSLNTYQSTYKKGSDTVEKQMLPLDSMFKSHID